MNRAIGLSVATFTLALSGAWTDSPPQESVQLVSLADAIEPLKSEFNKKKGTYRFVAILSPT